MRDAFLAAARKLRSQLRGGPARPSPIDLLHVLPTGLRVHVRGDSDWYVYNEIFVDGDYDQAIDEALDHASGPGQVVILDLGANVGYFTTRVVDRARSRRFPEDRLDVLMVEGSPSVYRDARERLAEAGYADGVATLVHGLVGRRHGTGEIAEVEFGARNTLFPAHNAGFADPGTMARHQVPFIDLVAHLGTDGDVALLKCDVEGAEQAVLEAYQHDLLPRVQVAIIELHHRLGDVGRCLELLAAAGLRPTRTVSATADTSLMMFERSA